MRKDIHFDNKEQVDKAKKNLVYVGILSIVMLFAGFTSAYIVSMGDSFWLKFPLPSSFWISTGVIAASSVAIQLALNFARKGNLKGLKVAILSTLLLGIAFVYFQFRGYGQLIDNGVHATGSYIVVSDGKYGDYYEVKMDGKFIDVDGNDFLIAGKKMTENQLKEYQNFMGQFIKVDTLSNFKVSNYDRFQIYFENEPLWLDKTQLKKSDSTDLLYLDRVRLKDLAINVKDGRGDFFVKGQIGKDFHIYYKGEELDYKDKELRAKGMKLSSYLQLKALESADTASSYLYIITFLHLLHIAVALIYMTKLVISSFSGKINKDNTISLNMGAVFWHFLGLLWIYLLLFLLFIH
jgi:cytochrome c oxidase subunit 3